MPCHAMGMERGPSGHVIGERRGADMTWQGGGQHDGSRAGERGGHRQTIRSKDQTIRSEGDMTCVWVGHDVRLRWWWWGGISVGRGEEMTC